MLEVWRFYWSKGILELRMVLEPTKAEEIQVEIY